MNRKIAAFINIKGPTKKVVSSLVTVIQQVIGSHWSWRHFDVDHLPELGKPMCDVITFGGTPAGIRQLFIAVRGRAVY